MFRSSLPAKLALHFFSRSANQERTASCLFSWYHSTQVKQAFEMNICVWEPDQRSFDLSHAYHLHNSALHRPGATKCLRGSSHIIPRRYIPPLLDFKILVPASYVLSSFPECFNRSSWCTVQCLKSRYSSSLLKLLHSITMWVLKWESPKGMTGISKAKDQLHMCWRKSLTVQTYLPETVPKLVPQERCNIRATVQSTIF